MTRSLEKSLDRSLEAAFRNNKSFVQWFVQRTKFAAAGASYEWSRSNWAWGKIPYDITDPVSGQITRSFRQSETDVLVILKTNGQNVALHIENKLASGSFEPHQPELYLARAKHWVGNDKYRKYVDWETVLVAPKTFLQKFRVAAAPFTCQIAHEDLVAYIPEFQASVSDYVPPAFVPEDAQATEP